VTAVTLLEADNPAALVPAASPTLAAKQAEPRLAYGQVADLPLPKTIMFSVGPEEITADAEEWARRGVTAFFLDFVARDWSSDIWAVDGKPWTIGASDETFQKVRKANEICRRIGSETFLKIAFDHPFEWFNDTQWKQIDNNFRQFAIFARDTSCTGIALDIEYVGDQYAFDWGGYTYDGYTRRDLIAKIRDRMTKAISGMYDEFPGMVFLTFPETGFSLGTVIHVAWIEEAARRNAPGGVHYCTEYTYRNPNIRYMFGHAWACNELFQKLLSPRGRKYWAAKCSIAAGIWPFGFDYQSVYDPGMPLKEFRQGYAASLMLSSKYNWIYSHNCREQLIGRGLDKYKGDADLKAYLRVIADREMVTTPKYVALARELRRMRPRDYSDDLGLAPAVSFAGPRDVPSLTLMPPASLDPRVSVRNWRLALDYFRGSVTDFHEYFGTQTHWMLMGPFPNGEHFTGHSAVYPPEQSIDLKAAHDGVNGKVRWIEHRQTGPLASVDLTKVFSPSEHVTAYALCWVISPAERPVQVRLGTNDAGKLWVGGALVFDYPYESTAMLDGEIIPVVLRAGATPILLKVSNGVHNWGFVFRITEPDGRPAKGLTFTVANPG
jgi:hypothetical protein